MPKSGIFPADILPEDIPVVLCIVPDVIFRIGEVMPEDAAEDAAGVTAAAGAT